MKEKEFRRNMAVFPIGSVMKLTDLSRAKFVTMRTRS